jgi:rubrerythrin
MPDAFSVEEVLAIAEQLERDGQRFYELAAQQCTDLSGKQALEHLARWEGAHGPIFAEIRARARQAAPESRSYDPDGVAELYLQAVTDSHVFNASGGPEVVLQNVSGPRQIFELALRFERDSIAFFQGLAALVSGIDDGTLSQLIDEEHEHVAYLQRVLKYGKW